MFVMTADSVELGRLPDVRMSFHLMGLHIREVGSRWTYPSHEHPMYELHWMIEGDMQMDVEGQIYDQKKETCSSYVRESSIRASRQARMVSLIFACISA